ncbi:MAG TPA: cupin domain-containing protein [Candidatus Binatia bacterium]
MSPVPAEAARWIEHLDLRAHPEGGYFRETYRTEESIARAALPARYDGARAFAAAVYFLLPSGDISALHRLRSDELWFFHAGSALTVMSIAADGRLAEVRVGADAMRGEHLQATVGAGCWFGAAVEAPSSFALVSCVVAPGFEFADFELGDRAALLRAFPQHRAVVERLTHPSPGGPS